MAQGVRAHRRLTALAVAAAAGCGEPPQPPPALPADAREVVVAIVARCVGRIPGSLGSVLLELRETPDDGTPQLVLCAGRRLRVDQPDRSVLLLAADGRGWRWRQGSDASPLADEEARALVRLRDLVQAACLQPLREMAAAERRGPNVIAVTGRDRRTWRLQIDPDTNLPASLSGEPGAVGYHGWLDTGVSVVPQRVELDDLGFRHVRLVASGLQVDDWIFQDPATRPSGAVLAVRGEHGQESRPVQPQGETVAGGLFLRLPDPTDWAARADAIIAAGLQLGEQGQIGEPLPFLFRDQDGAWIGIPFVPDQELGGRPFIARPDQDIQRRPTHRVAAVLRPRSAGGIEAKVADAERALRAWVAEQGLRAVGPLRTVPYLAWERGDPKGRLDTCPVRLELPVE